MLTLDVTDRFGTMSHIYFHSCREHYEDFKKYSVQLGPKLSMLRQGKCRAPEVFLVLNNIERYWASAVVFGAMCLEAFIYDYAATYFSDTYVRRYLDKLDLKAKWVVIPKLVTGKKFPTGSKAFQNLHRLVSERNLLVHHKSKPSKKNLVEVVTMAAEYKDKIAKTRTKLNPYEAVVAVLTELRKLEDDDETRVLNWELIDEDILE